MSETNGGGGIPLPPVDEKTYGGSGEDDLPATIGHLDSVVEYVAFLADRLEIACQAIVYNAHEHERLLVAMDLRSIKEAHDTVRALAQDLDVAMSIVDDEEGEDGQEEEATSDAEGGNDTA